MGNPGWVGQVTSRSSFGLTAASAALGTCHWTILTALVSGNQLDAESGDDGWRWVAGVKQYVYCLGGLP